MPDIQSTIYQLKYVADFRCDSSKCKQNCCQIYSIWIEDYDYELLHTKAPDVAKLITKKDGKYLVPSDDDACLFLKDGLCSIHAQYGENTIPEVCYTYPRLYFEMDNKTYVTSNLLCDYIIKLIYSAKNPFDIIENTSCRIPLYIDEQKQYTYDNFKDLYKNNLIDLYTDVLKLVDNDNLTSTEVITALVDLSSKLDKSPKGQWHNIINEYITGFDINSVEKNTDFDSQQENLKTVADIFIDIYTKGQNQNALEVLTKLKDNIENNPDNFSLEKDQALKTYIKIKLSENFFPLNAWYSCMTEMSMLVSGYMLLKEALKLNDSISIDDISYNITSIELAMLIYRSDLFETFYSKKINTYVFLMTLIK
ncbi:MAG: flagellin lysine-N-methylase [Vampirovibrionia bacterium]